MSTELIIVVVAFILLLAAFIVVYKIYIGKIEDLKIKIIIKDDKFNSLHRKYREKIEEIHAIRASSRLVKKNYDNLVDIVDEIDSKLLNNLVAISDKGNKLNYFKIQTIQKKDLSKFKGVKVGDKIAYVTRRIKSKSINVPVTLKLNRD